MRRSQLEVGQYKVPQNVEAEDHILGPLTFRQFIYALIGFFWAAACFGLFRGVPVVMAVLGFPVTMLFLLLAFFRRDGQDFEQLLIAMVGFFAASHIRLWVKEEIAETFHITPTPVAAEVTQRNPAVVRSELEKLATLVDSRGWNLPPDVLPANPSALPATAHEDRIVPPPPPTPRAPSEVSAKDDIFDLKASPLAQNLAVLLNEAADDVREEAMSQMSAPTPRKGEAPEALSTSAVTAMPQNDIVKLATLNDDLTVSQIAAQAERIAPAPEPMQRAFAQTEVEA